MVDPDYLERNKGKEERRKEMSAGRMCANPKRGTCKTYISIALTNL